MEKIVKKRASIIWPYEGINYNVCALTEICLPDGFAYEFVPDYFVLSLIDEKVFEGIQGIDLSRKQEKYVRDYIPVFVSERTPPENRVNIREILHELNLDYYDPLDIMVNTKDQYCGDKFFVVKYIEKKIIDFDCLLNKTSRTNAKIKEVLDWIANGDNFNNIKSNKRKKDIFCFYKKLYKVPKVNKRPCLNSIIPHQVGRPRVLSDEDASKIIKLYLNHNFGMKELVALSGCSKSTFLRRLKEYRNSN